MRDSLADAEERAADKTRNRDITERDRRLLEGPGGGREGGGEAGHRIVCGGQFITFSIMVSHARPLQIEQDKNTDGENSTNET